jgi:hypothetical protein
MEYSSKKGLGNLQDVELFCAQVKATAAKLAASDPKTIPTKEEVLAFNTDVTNLNVHCEAVGRVQNLFFNEFGDDAEMVSKLTGYYLAYVHTLSFLTQINLFYQEIKKGNVFFISDEVVYSLPVDQSRALINAASKCKEFQAKLNKPGWISIFPFSNKYLSGTLLGSLLFILGNILLMSSFLLLLGKILIVLGAGLSAALAVNFLYLTVTELQFAKLRKQFFLLHLAALQRYFDRTKLTV